MHSIALRWLNDELTFQLNVLRGTTTISLILCFILSHDLSLCHLPNHWNLLKVIDNTVMVINSALYFYFLRERIASFFLMFSRVSCKSNHFECWKHWMRAIWISDLYKIILECLRICTNYNFRPIVVMGKFWINYLLKSSFSFLLLFSLLSQSIRTKMAQTQTYYRKQVVATYRTYRYFKIIHCHWHINLDTLLKAEVKILESLSQFYERKQKNLRPWMSFLKK